MRQIVAVSLLVFALASCGGPSDEDVLTQDKIRASQSAPELPDVELSDNPEPPAAPTPPPAEELALNELDNAVLENAVEPDAVQGPIPAAFRDRWGMVPADCRPGGDLVGNGLVITADTLLSGESVGRLKEVVGDEPERFTGSFEYDGVARDEQLVLTGSSNTLVRVAGNQRYVYHRCRVASPTG